MEPSAGELASPGVDRELTIERDACAAFDEAGAFASRRKSQSFEPLEDEDAEAVVELGDPHVTGLQLVALSCTPDADPIASTETTRRVPVLATFRFDTTNATDPSTGTSQSYMHKGSEISRDDR
jgi:hypothetical protein